MKKFNKIPGDTKIGDFGPGELFKPSATMFAGLCFSFLTFGGVFASPLFELFVVLSPFGPLSGNPSVW